MALLSQVLYYRVWPDFPGSYETAKYLQPVATSYEELMALARILTQGRPPVIQPVFRTAEEAAHYRQVLKQRDSAMAHQSKQELSERGEY